MSMNLKDDILNAVRESKINRTCRCKTPRFRKPTVPPQYNAPPMPSVQPPKPPTSGSNAAKPNPNYVPPASVVKPRIYVMKLEDLDNWVKTIAQIGDVAYYHDRILDHHYIYRYRKPDDNPIWTMMNPDFLEKYSKKDNKGDNKMNITGICAYKTPCGWCTKWDKKCDRKPYKRGLRVKINPVDDAFAPGLSLEKI